MNLFAILRSRIDSLPEGDQSLGWMAVLRHLEIAFNHYSRGQRNDEDSAFTDVIYRTNQAFEGGIKEAYRVLAGQDPTHKRPFDIENYLDSNTVFRPRVLAHFTNYRKEWRNPSAHDHRLDFDESEAFLAIVSVSAFACLLIDEISEKIAFSASKLLTEKNKAALAEQIPDKSDSLLELVADMMLAFAKEHGPTAQIRSEAQLSGSLIGFFTTLVPSIKVIQEYQLVDGKPERADFDGLP